MHGERSKPGGMSTTAKDHTAVWRIERQMNSQRSAQNSPAGWSPPDRTARRQRWIARRCSPTRVRWRRALTGTPLPAPRRRAPDVMATGGSGGMAKRRYHENRISKLRLAEKFGARDEGYPVGRVHGHARA